ncbi:MAG: hypothetical protein FJW96_09625 [Actinobacteria bacterium]|nr:hypothetical protein [Actinomycetota bacterium]
MAVAQLTLPFSVDPSSFDGRRAIASPPHEDRARIADGTVGDGNDRQGNVPGARVRRAPLGDETK